MEKRIQNWTEGKIDTILISTWNEYPERMAIAPIRTIHHTILTHILLYNTTKDYINQIHQLGAKFGV